jgi:hypothetical protein
MGAAHDGHFRMSADISEDVTESRIKGIVYEQSSV